MPASDSAPTITIQDRSTPGAMSHALHALGFLYEEGQVEDPPDAFVWEELGYFSEEQIEALAEFIGER